MDRRVLIRKLTVFDDISLTIPEGMCFIVSEGNGEGKTTVLDVLSQAQYGTTTRGADVRFLASEPLSAFAVVSTGEEDIVAFPPQPLDDPRKRYLGRIFSVNLNSTFSSTKENIVKFIEKTIDIMKDEIMAHLFEMFSFKKGEKETKKATNTEELLFLENIIPVMELATTTKRCPICGRKLAKVEVSSLATKLKKLKQKEREIRKNISEDFAKRAKEILSSSVLRSAFRNRKKELVRSALGEILSRCVTWLKQRGFGGFRVEGLYGELEVTFKGRPVDMLSSGERLWSLSLVSICLARLLKGDTEKITGQRPSVFIDDVFDVLDVKKREQILSVAEEFSDDIDILFAFRGKGEGWKYPVIFLKGGRKDVA